MAVRTARAARCFAATLLVLLAALVAPAIASATTYTVVSADDVADGTCPPAACNLRQAINSANASPGLDRIEFAIVPGGPQQILLTRPLPDIAGPTVVDGTTQPGYGGAPLVELSAGAAAASSGLRFRGGDSALLALVVNGFSGGSGVLLASDRNTIEGSYVGTDRTGTLDRGNREGISVTGVENRIGGLGSGDGNVISGNDNWGVGICAALIFGNFCSTATAAAPPTRNEVLGNLVGTDVSGNAPLGNQIGIRVATNGNVLGSPAEGGRNIVSGNFNGFEVYGTFNLVQGNYVGTNVAGAAPVPNANMAVRVDGNDNTVGGTVRGSGNVVSGNLREGIVLNSPATRNVVVGNLVGTDATGTAPLGNGAGSRGVLVNFTNGNRIGGPGNGERNVISANGVGLWIIGNANVLQGNFIGTDITGTQPLPNRGDGVQVQGNDNRIGGRNQGEGNLIAYNGDGGVKVYSGVRNPILSNSIFENRVGLGIDLGGNGLTPNDPGDADPGPNELQNFPELTTTRAGGGRTEGDGVLNSKPLTTYLLQFFRSERCDPSQHGEGRTLIGEREVTTDATGVATFSFGFSGGGQEGDVITSTATDPLGNTSEFSRCSQAGELISGSVTTLSPAAATNDVGTRHTVTATVVSFSDPGQTLAGVTVYFTVTGSVTTSGQCTTGADGQCSFTYTGPTFPGADLIRAYADADEDGQRDAEEVEGIATKAWVLPASTQGQVTGGGHAGGAGEVAFGFNAQSGSNGPKGRCNVIDRTTLLHVKCLDVVTLVVTATHATIYGNAEVNGQRTQYRIDVDDLGEPGAGRDTFTIQTDSGYVGGGVLTQGNVQIHR